MSRSMFSNVNRKTSRVNLERRRYSFNFRPLDLTVVTDHQGTKWFFAHEVVKGLRELDHTNAVNYRRVVKKHVSSVNKGFISQIIGENIEKSLISNYNWNTIIITEHGFEQIVHRSRKIDV